MRLAPCDWQQILEAKQRTEGRYELVDDIVVFCFDTAGSVDRTRLFGALCELTSRVQIQDRCVQAHGMPSVKVRLAVEAARLAAGRMVIKGRNKMKSSFVFRVGGNCSRGNLREDKKDGKRAWGV